MPPVLVQEEMVALFAAERGTRLQTVGDAKAAISVSMAHDRAPEQASGVFDNGNFFGGSVEATQRVDIEIAVVVQIGKLATPAPAAPLD